MTTERFLFLLFLWIFSYVVIAGFIATILVRSSKTNGRSGMTLAVGLVFAAIFLDGISMFVANGFGYEVRPKPTLGYAISFWTGKSQLLLAVLGFGLYLLTQRRKKPPQ